MGKQRTNIMTLWTSLNKRRRRNKNINHREMEKTREKLSNSNKIKCKVNFDVIIETLFLSLWNRRWDGVFYEKYVHLRFPGICCTPPLWCEDGKYIDDFTAAPINIPQEILNVIQLICFLIPPLFIFLPHQHLRRIKLRNVRIPIVVTLIDGQSDCDYPLNWMCLRRAAESQGLSHPSAISLHILSYRHPLPSLNALRKSLSICNIR